LLKFTNYLLNDKAWNYISPQACLLRHFCISFCFEDISIFLDISDCICKLKKLKVLHLHSNRLTILPHGLIFLNSLTELSLRENPLVVRFVREMDFKASTLLELTARVIKSHRLPYSEDDLPRSLVSQTVKSATKL